MLKSSPDMIIDLKELKKIVQLFEGTALSELEIEGKEIKVRMKKGIPQKISVALPQESGQETPAVKEAPAKPEQKQENLRTITAPMVGTFYRAPSPDAPPFVEKGDIVDKDDVICIIEAMKIMNEIKAEVKGKIKEILVDNGEVVEFAQPLFLLEPLT